MTTNQVSDVIKKFFEDFERGSNTFYILFIKDDSPQVVFYLTHENLMKIMQEVGLVRG